MIKIEVKGNSYDLMGAIDRLPENTVSVILVENAVTSAKLNFEIYPFVAGETGPIPKLYAPGAIPKGCMAHYIPTVEQFRQYAQRVNQVRLRLFLDDEEV